MSDKQRQIQSAFSVFYPVSDLLFLASLRTSCDLVNRALCQVVNSKVTFPIIQGGRSIGTILQFVDSCGNGIFSMDDHADEGDIIMQDESSVTSPYTDDYHDGTFLKYLSCI